MMMIPACLAADSVLIIASGPLLIAIALIRLARAPSRSPASMLVLARSNNIDIANDAASLDDGCSSLSAIL